ncbi:MAG: Holliday junction resolvase-like protein [Leptolyngbyaceae cyanobacterium bins.349]|nr:Holliday junction resolvase-like protein [Leptolyngbyaceae cyanobacterium bins.349]
MDITSIILLILGVVIGAGIACTYLLYFFKQEQKNLEKQKRQSQTTYDYEAKLKRELESMRLEYQERLKRETDLLKKDFEILFITKQQEAKNKVLEEALKDYERKLRKETETLRLEYQERLKRETDLLKHQLDVEAMKKHQEIKNSAEEEGLAKFNQEKKKLEEEFFRKYEIQLLEWKQQAEKEIRASSLLASRNTIKGKISEQILPLLPGLIYELSEMRFIGSPVDYIIFDGYNEAKNGQEEIKSIILADVKRGRRAKLSPIQRKIRDAIDKGRFRWETIIIRDDLSVSIEQ